MTYDEIQNEIKRRKKMYESRKKAAIEAINDDALGAAGFALTEAAGHKEVIDEYSFRLEEMEVNGLD